jgi:PAS domain S-box-containing protein
MVVDPATDATRSRPGLAFIVAVAWIAAVTGVKLVFRDAIGEPTPFLLYFFAVLAASLIGGIAAGLLTTFATLVLGFALFFPDPTALDTPRLLAAVAYAAEGVAISWVGARVGADRRRKQLAQIDADAARERLELVLGAVEDGISVQNSEGRLVYANEAAAKVSGFASAAEMVAATPEALARRYEVYSATGERLPFDRLPGRILLKGGEARPELIRSHDLQTDRTRWLLLRANGIRDDEGRIRSVVNIIQDVTERHEQEQALAVSREWFSTALRSIGDAVIATDAKGMITFANPVAEALTGWPLAEARGRPLADVFRIIHEDDRKPAVSPVDKVIAEGVVVGLANHTILIRRDGSEVAIDDSAAPIRGSGDALEGVVLVFRDVANLRREQIRTEFLARATAELNSSLDYTTTLANIAKLAVPTIADWAAVDVVEHGERRRLAVAHVDHEKIEFVREIEARYPPDPEATTGVPQILRTGKPEMISEIPSELLVAAAKDEEHLRIIRALALRSYIGVPLLRGGQTFGAITLVMAESNRIYDADDLGFALALADRASIAVENARLYQVAEEARREAERANRTKDEFLAMLGHELRNPLAPILSTLDLLASPSGISIERARKVIDRQVKHLVRLVDDLLDVSRITRGRVEIEHEPVEIADVALKALELTSPLIEQRNHRVSTNVPTDLFVLGDAVRLTQIFANLLTNAAKYTEPGGNLRIDATKDGEWIEVRVVDDGIGIPPDMLGRIFDLFVQAPQDIDRAQGGLGLGLSIVQNLVQLHGGTIAAKSEGVGKGSELVVRLPATQPIEPRVAAPSRPEIRAQRGPLDILVVDDNEDAVELLGEMLRLLGHRPHTAVHPTDALELAAKVKPALALLDIGLPEIDGYELARRLRTIDGLQAMRIVALTGYGQASDRAKSAASGFDSHLVKPVGIDHIRAAIDAVPR